MDSDPKNTLAVKQKVAQPPGNKTTTSARASKTANTGSVARQGTNQIALKASKDLVKKETRGKADTSHSNLAKIAADVEENTAAKPRGLQVPMTTTKTILDLLKLFNANDTDTKPTVFRSPGKTTDMGVPEKNGKNVPEKKVINKTPTNNADRKLPLR